MTGATISGSGRPRRLWKAGLAGHVVMTTLIWATVMAWLAYDHARLDDAHAFEGDGVMPPPDLFTAGWLANAAIVYGRIAFVTLAYAIPLMLFLANFEGRFARAGALAGAAAALPLAAAWVTVAWLSPHLVPWPTFVMPAFLLLLFGTAGGLAAGHVRTGARR